MTPSKSVYLETVLRQLPRALSLLDRSPFSASYGSFHRGFWLHRTSDFPSAIHQQSAYLLARIWRLRHSENPYFDHPAVLEWCRAAVLYTLKLQRRDGSFDEWYPGERGWAGPTGYILHAWVEAYRVVEKTLSESERRALREAFLRSALFLGAHEEIDVLANHQDMAHLGMSQAFALTQDARVAAGIESLWKRFERSCDKEEGWSLEYDGADPGYQTATLSFLARYHRISGDARVLPLVERQLEFVSHFFYPDRSFGGTIGSRNTANIFHFGLEYWASHFPLAETLARASRESLQAGRVSSPEIQEDHYLLYRLPEFLDAFETESAPERPELPKLPCEVAGDFDRRFARAGIRAVKTRSHYVVASFAKGGVIKAFDCRSKKQVYDDCGWVLVRESGRAITSSWIDPHHQVDLEKGIVRGAGHRIKAPLFSPLKLVAFRLLLLALSANATSSRLFKAWIRRKLMTGQEREPIRFERQVAIAPNELRVSDRVEIPSASSIRAFFRGGEITARFVPQSRYFLPVDLEFPTTPVDENELRRIRKSSAYVNETRIPLT